MLGAVLTDMTVLAVEAAETHNVDSTAVAVMDAPNVNPETLTVQAPPAVAVVVPISEPLAYKTM